MSAVLALGSVAFLLCLFLTPICRDLFLRYDIVDRPDTDRKFHLRPIPQVGGIAIVVSYALAIGLMYLLAPQGARIYVQHQRLLLTLLPAAAIVFFTGVLDDIKGLKPWQKLAGQFVAATLAASLGARIDVFHNIPVSPWLSMPISILWLIACTNAVNLIDGMDGLASGVGLFATLTTLVAAILTGNLGLAMATAPLAGCLLAFLRYNFSPASIFLGDCGSLTIGFMLGCFGLIWSHHGGTLLGMSLPLMALSLPLIDVALAICRRALRKVPIFQGDRGHIHHMVLARGFTPHMAALILYAFCAAVAGLALLQTFFGFKFSAPIFLAFGVLIWVGVNYLGYIELRAVRRIFSRTRLLSLLRDEIYLQELDRSFHKVETLDGFWEAARTACVAMRFSQVKMYFAETSFEAQIDPEDLASTWTLTLSLGKRGHLMLARSAHKDAPKSMMAVLGYLQDAAGRLEAGFVAALPSRVPEPQPTQEAVLVETVEIYSDAAA